MKQIKKILKKLLYSLPHVKTMKRQLDLMHVPPGHFYSPINHPDIILENAGKIWADKTNVILEIDLNESEQYAFLEEIKKYYPEFPFKQKPVSGFNYYCDNGYYGASDSVFLYSMLRHFRPKKVIEIGSGFSSLLMVEVNKHFLKSETQFHFIEPNPERLLKLLQENDCLLKEKVQHVDVKLFESLDEGDILFVDSSHVSKTGSDLNHIIFEILPRLKKGVLIHFHDIFYPFEYPKNWVVDKYISWNEAYILRAFLMYNKHFKIIAYNTFLQDFHESWFEENMPFCLENRGGSIWLQKSL